MKKFLAIVMCLAMALSMMTVVSFAAVTVGGANVTAAPGEVVEIPVYVSGVAATGMTQITINVPFEFEVVYGTITEADTVVDGNTIIVYNDAGITYGADAAFTIKATAPAAEGDYELVFVEDENFIIDTDFNDMEATFTNIVLTVKAAEVTPEATIIDVPVAPTADNAVVTVFQVAGNAKEFGVVYDGVEYPSAATAADLANYYAFAVELIGADGAITAYAK